MSLANRLNNNFRVQSQGTQILIIAIAIFIIELLRLSFFSAIIGTGVVVAVSWLISFLIIKIFDKNGDYSLHTIWKTLMVVYMIYSVVTWLL